MPDNPKALVLMPFSSDFSDIYTGFLRPVLEDNGFVVSRADDIGSRQNILRAVLDGIANSDLIVADMTGANANVFYEVGIAHGLKRQVLLFTQDVNEIPFDLKLYQHLEYKRDFAQMDEAKRLLAEKLESIRLGSLTLDNPVTDFLPETETSTTPSRLINQEVIRIFSRAAVRYALDSAIEATGAYDWGGNTGCFPVSSRAFDRVWNSLLESGDVELSTVAVLSILDAVIEGTNHERTRLGGRFAPDVLRHIKDHMGETLDRDRVTVIDDSTAGNIWDAMCISMNHYLDRSISENLIQNWRESSSNSSG